MSLCILGGAGVLRLAVAAFSLGWTHSIEKTRWEEDWTVGADGLHLVQARIESMGAGMETPDGATFDGTWWRWTPKVPVLPEVLLRRSDAVPQGWRLCADGVCRPVGAIEETSDIVTLKPCP
jgi:hypothetical protein